MTRAVLLLIPILAAPAVAHAVELRPQVGHTAGLRAVAFSADGRLLATAADDRVVLLWEVATGKVLRAFAAGSELRGVAFSPDGKRLASVTNDMLQIWDVAGGKLLGAAEGAGGKVAFSPDGRLIATLPRIGAAAIKLWSATDRPYAFGMYVGHKKEIGGLSFSPDGKRIASASEDGTIKLWDVNRPGSSDTSNDRERDDSVRTLTGHKGFVDAAVFTPDGKLIVSGGTGDDLRVWEVSTGKLVRTIPGQDGLVWSLATSKDGRFVAAGNSDKTVRVSDLKSGKLIHTLPGHADWIPAVAFSPDGKTIASASQDRTARLWDAASGAVVRVLAGEVGPLRSVAFSPDGRHLVPSGSDPTARLWELDGARLVRSFAGHEKSVKAAAFSADGKLLATAGADSTVRLWDLASARELRTLKGPGGPYSSVILSPDGKLVAAGSQDTQYSNNRVWDIATGKELESTWTRVFEDRGAFSPDGKWLVGWRTLSDTLLIHEPVSTKPIDGQGDRVVERKLNANSRWINDAAFGRDGLIATAGQDKQVKLWRMETGELVREIPHADVVLDVAFAPDGKRLASATLDGVIHLWEADGKPIRDLAGHTDWIGELAFSPDGRFIASASRDGTLRLWRIDTGASIVMLSSTSGEWLVYTDDGYFDASPRGGELVAMVEGTRAYSIEQLALRNNRPDLILERMGLGAPAMQAYYRARHEKRLAGAKLTEAELSGSLGDLPESAIVRAELLPSGTEAQLAIRIGDKKGLRAYQVYDNGVPIFGGQGKDISGKSFSGKLKVALAPGEHHLEVGAINTRGQESFRALGVLESKKELPRELYFVGFGVGAYTDDAIPPLAYSAADARDLASAFSRLPGYAKAHVAAYTDAEVTKESIRRAKDVLAAAKPQDTVVLFIAGHGLHDDDELATYYYLTHETRLGSLRDTAASFDEVEALLSGVAARQKVFLMDTCESGEREDELESGVLGVAKGRSLTARAITRGLKRKKGDAAPEAPKPARPWLLERDRYIYQDLARRTGAMVFSSSRGSEFSYESEAVGHGLFTHAILQGFGERAADVDHDGRITRDELQRWVAARVAELSRELQHPTIDRDNPYLRLTFELARSSESAR